MININTPNKETREPKEEIIFQKEKTSG